MKTNKCRRCGRSLRPGNTNPYGARCARVVAAATRSRKAPGSVAAKAQEDIAQGRLALVSRTPQIYVYQNGPDSQYIVTPFDCHCRASRFNMDCRHRQAAVLLTQAA